MRTAILSFTQEEPTYMGSLSFDRGVVVAYRSSFVAVNVLAIACVDCMRWPRGAYLTTDCSDCEGLIPRRKEDNQVELVYLNS